MPEKYFRDLKNDHDYNKYLIEHPAPAPTCIVNDPKEDIIMVTGSAVLGAVILCAFTHCL